MFNFEKFTIIFYFTLSLFGEINRKENLEKVNCSTLLFIS